MFTGIIQELGKVADRKDRNQGLELKIQLYSLGDSGRIGDSIAVCGVCLTLEELSQGVGTFFLSKETLDLTWLGELRVGDEVNLEKALCVGEPMGGHLVQGHVEAVGKVVDRKPEGEGERMGFEVPTHMAKYLLNKGSITIDGISLTIAGVENNQFGVALIPVTMEKTNLKHKSPGDPVNLEADFVGKWVEQLLKNR